MLKRKKFDYLAISESNYLNLVQNYFICTEEEIDKKESYFSSRNKFNLKIYKKIFLINKNCLNLN